MKVILSRKGFDLKHGGIPSPILPDGTLLSLPKPNEFGHIKYDELLHCNTSYLDIIHSLKPKLTTTFKHARCSPNPDIQKNIYWTPPDWKPAYGQYGPSESHLDSQKITVGDIFLFYGWFKQTAYDADGMLRYVPNAPELHIIFGYLQIGAILKNNGYIARKYHWHSNAHIDNKKKKHNTMYLPTKNLCYNNRQKGYGCLPYSKKLVLTMEGEHYNRWNLPNSFRNTDVTISYHNNVTNGFIPGKDFFQASSIGQEFVITGSYDLQSWVHQLISTIPNSNRHNTMLHDLSPVNHINHPDSSGNIYCRRKNKITPLDCSFCQHCKGFRKGNQTQQVECCWIDYSPEEQSSFQVHSPSEEYKRVNWLIDKQFIPKKSDLD